MTKVCDHKSVGIFIWNDDKLLLIERKRFPVGFAVPAGHVDADKTFEEAAIRELREEVGLEVEKIELLSEVRKENPCRREGGTWHEWKLYRAETNGELKASDEETKQARFMSFDEIKVLADKTEKYNRGEISEEVWNKAPGLEPVMLEHFKDLKIL